MYIYRCPLLRHVTHIKVSVVFIYVIYNFIYESLTLIIQAGLFIVSVKKMTVATMMFSKQQRGNTTNIWTLYWNDPMTRGRGESVQAPIRRSLFPLVSKRLGGKLNQCST